jgi:hypothetical protein
MRSIVAQALLFAFAFAAIAPMAALGCDSGPREPPAGAAPPATPAKTSGTAAPAKTPDGAAKSRHPGVPRVVALGDVHGDLVATRAALRLAGALKEGDLADRWAGGSLVVVQVGDQLDRGDQERAILDLFDRLADEAKKAGGAFHALNGNHEVMNVAFDFRYVTEGGFHDFEGLSGMPLSDPRLAELPPRSRARAAAFLPGAPYAKLLGKRDVAVVIGDTAFVHGGLLPQHVRYGIDRINSETRAWMNGESKSPPGILMGDDAPIWTRLYSGDAPTARECDTLRQALAALSVKRMVVGHTVQRNGITSACDGKIWRIDVGLATYYGGRTEVLEIVGDEVRPVRAGADAAVPPSSSATPR